MKRALNVGLVAMLATQVLVIGQGQDVAKILAEVRAALGGEEKLASLKTLTVEGKSTRSMPNGTSQSSHFDMAFELPSKFSKKDVLGNINGMEIARTAGFNGDGLVELIETPPQMGGGMVFTRAAGGGAAPIGGTGATQTPEQIAQQRQAMLLGNKKDFARLTLGMFATSFSAYPMEFTYGGIAEAPEGKAHVIDVKGADNFVARLFVDTESHLPLMLSWMDKEPLQMTSRGGVPMVMPGAGSGTQVMRGGGGGGQTVMSGGGSGGTQATRGVGPGGRPMTAEDVEKMRADMDARMREAEAKRRVVEYRMFYSDYKAFDGVKLPTRIQRMVDGNPTEEIEFEKVRVNGRVDQKKFEVVK